MTIRRFVFLSHRYVGLTAALFLLIAAATGCLLVFRPELDAALNPSLFTVTRRPPLPALELVSMVQHDHPDWRIRSFDLQTDPGRTLQISLAPSDTHPGGGIIDAADQIFIDPADGRVVGMRSSGPGLGRRTILQAVYLLHYTLLAGFVGRWLMGTVAFAWLGLTIAGIIVTWPRRRPWLSHWTPAWQTSSKTLKRRPMPELHRVSGLWLAAPLAVLAATSVAMNFFDEAFRPVVEFLSPPRSSPFDRPPPARPAGLRHIGFAAAEKAAIVVAARETPLLSPVAITDDAAHDFYDVSFAPGGTRLYEGFGRVSYAIDRDSGRVAWIDQPRRDGIGRLVLRSLYPLHSGQVYGLPTRLLVLLLGLVTSGLALTGILPWWKRRRHHVRRATETDAWAHRPQPSSRRPQPSKRPQASKRP